MVMALAGNKADMEDKRKVTAEVSITVFSIFLLWHVHYKNYNFFNNIDNWLQQWWSTIFFLIKFQIWKMVTIDNFCCCIVFDFTSSIYSFYVWKPYPRTITSSLESSNKEDFVHLSCQILEFFVQVRLEHFFAKY